MSGSITSYNECNCEYDYEEKDCKNTLHVYFCVGFDNVIWDTTYLLIKGHKRLEFYSKELLDEWLDLSNYPNTWRIKILGLQDYRYRIKQDNV